MLSILRHGPFTGLEARAQVQLDALRYFRPEAARIQAPLPMAWDYGSHRPVSAGTRCRLILHDGLHATGRHSQRPFHLAHAGTALWAKTRYSAISHVLFSHRQSHCFPVRRQVTLSRLHPNCSIFACVLSLSPLITIFTGLRPSYH